MDRELVFLTSKRCYNKQPGSGGPEFKQSLLELNRRHRLEAVRMYVRIISKIEKKVGRKKSLESADSME